MPQLRLRKPNAILFDVKGTAANTTFVDRILIVYLRKSVKAFLSNNWNHEQIQRDINFLRNSAKAQSWPPVAESSEQPDVILQSVETLVNYLLDNDLDCLAFAQLRIHVWFDGYEKGLLVTPIYSDVAIQMQRWRCDYDIHLYVMSNGWAEANKVFFSRTNQGDMSLLIDGYFDTEIGQMDDPNTYRKVLQKIGQPAASVVLFTKSGPSATAAARIGILPILVMTHKKCYESLSDQEKKMAIIRTMNEIEFEEC